MKKNKPFSALGFGEVMLRLSPSGQERISQGETFEKHAGGSELNVVSGISQLGLRTGIITKLPNNEIGKFINNKIRYSGTSDDYIIFDERPEKRLGVYYYENGSYPRIPTVVYDRAQSSFTSFDISELPEEAYESTELFHVSGITPALSETIRANMFELIKRFKKHGTKISFDVNYRASLWDEDAAREAMEAIMQETDVLFISEETLRRMFRQTGPIREILARFSEAHKEIGVIFSTKREVLSPRRHTFGSISYDCEKRTFFEEEPYKNIEVVDRIGSGDAYVAGALFGLLAYGDKERAVQFGNAMSALKDTVPGDMTTCDKNDILRVIDAHQNGQASEMHR